MDPVDLQIQWSRLSSIMDEVDAALVRTSFSTIVGETRDFAVVLLDGEARSIAQSQLSSPAFTCSLPIATRSMLQEFPPETLEPGDALITNDPWLCHGHLPDFYIVVPLFADTGVTAFIATAAHITDIGGRLDEFDSRDVHEEGFRIPPSKLYSGGKRNRLLFRLLEANIPHAAHGHRGCGGDHWRGRGRRKKVRRVHPGLHSASIPPYRPGYSDTFRSGHAAGHSGQFRTVGIRIGYSRTATGRIQCCTPPSRSRTRPLK